MGDEEVDSQIAQLDEQIEKLSGDDSKYGYPVAPTKESVFKFFKHIIGLEDSSKIGNLDTTELGNLKLGVRPYQDIANYAEAERLDTVAKYLRTKAETVLATSLSKKGKLVELFVTQIKREQKAGKPETKKKGWFSRPEKEPEQ